MTMRRGAGLLEVLVALPLIALIGTITVQLLLTVHRQVVREDGSIGATRELRQGAYILASELRGLRARDVVAWSDTSIEFDALVGTGIVCGVNRAAFTVDLVDDDENTAVTVAGDADPLAVVWNQPVQVGDRVALWALDRSAPADTLRSIQHALRGSTSGAQCVGSPLLAPAATTVRLSLADSIASDIPVGTPARVTRRIRYSLYRAGDGDWFLGRRTRGSTGWDVIQPVAGPLLSAAAAGLRLSVHDAAGAVLVDTTGAPHRVRIAVRAPRRAGRAAPVSPGVDSVTTHVVLRADRGGTP